MHLGNNQPVLDKQTTCYNCIYLYLTQITSCSTGNKAVTLVRLVSALVTVNVHLTGAGIF